MKWFKHISDSADDPDVDDSMTLFGSDGYVVFFRTLEIMSREFDIKNPGSSTFSISFYRKKFRISWKKLSKILKFFEKRKRFFVTFSNGDGLDLITINCPKLKDYCDEYTKKRLAPLSGQTPDKLRSKEIRSKNKIKKEIKKALPPKKLKRKYSANFEDVWNHYQPSGRKSKAKAYEIYNRLIKEKLLPEHDALIDILNDQTDERIRMKDKAVFCPEPKHLTTWLNQHCWEDEPVEFKEPPSDTVRHPEYQGIEAADKRVAEITKNLF